MTRQSHERINQIRSLEKFDSPSGPQPANKK